MRYGLQYIDIKRKDYVLGRKVSLKQTILVPDGQWDNWLPSEEVQNFPIETDACTTFAILNAVEILLRYEYKNTENLSDRFLAYITGTGSKHGNNPQAVAEALRTKGDVREKLWMYTADLKTWKDIYAIPPQILYAKALKFINTYKFGHEWVLATPKIMKQALQYSPLTVAGWAWDMNSRGLYFSPKGKVPEHYFVVYGYVDGEYWKVFDSYDNSLKKLVWYFHFAMVKRFTLHSKKVIETRLMKAIIFLSQQAIVLLKELIQKKQVAVVPTVKKIEPRKDNLVTFATAIRDFEGKPGDLNYKNNNPGNFRCSPVGYSSAYGVVRCIGNFAVFPTYQQGWHYLLNSISNRVKKHPQWTFLDFFNDYAPPSDNNPTKSYATFVATRCGVSINTKLSEYF